MAVSATSSEQQSHDVARTGKSANRVGRLGKNAALCALSAGCQGGNGSQSVAHPTNSMMRLKRFVVYSPWGCSMENVWKMKFN